MLVPPVTFWIAPAPTGPGKDLIAANTTSSKACRPAGVRVLTSAALGDSAEAVAAGVVASDLTAAFAFAFATLVGFLLPRWFGDLLAGAAVRVVALLPTHSSPSVMVESTLPNSSRHNCWSSPSVREGLARRRST